MWLLPDGQGRSLFKDFFKFVQFHGPQSTVVNSITNRKHAKRWNRSVGMIMAYASPAKAQGTFPRRSDSRKANSAAV